MKTKKKSGKTVRKSVGEKSGNLMGIKNGNPVCSRYEYLFNFKRDLVAQPVKKSKC